MKVEVGEVYTFEIPNPPPYTPMGLFSGEIVEILSGAYLRVKILGLKFGVEIEVSMDNIVPKKAKPPLGLQPKLFWKQSRFESVRQAIVRYVESGEPLKSEWVKEYNELAKEVRKHDEPFSEGSSNSDLSSEEIEWLEREMGHICNSGANSTRIIEKIETFLKISNYGKEI